MGNVWYEGWEKDEDMHHPILEKHRDLLQKLIDERVFKVGHADGIFYLLEECDEYFGIELRKEQARELSDLFGEIANFLEKEGEEIE